MAAGSPKENELKNENSRVLDLHDEILQIEMLFQSPVISVGYKEYSLENFVDKRYFGAWKGRENCTDTDAMRQGLNIDGILSTPNPSKNEVLTYLQYTLNIAELCRRRFNEDNGRSSDFNIKRYTELLTSIRRILRALDYDVRFVPDKEIIYLVARNIAADAVADNSDDVETDKIIEYNSFAVAGNMQRKREILLSMGDTIESYSDNMAPGNVKLYSNIEFMLHNFNIRTDNTTGEDRVEYVADMSEEELEKWYDEAYQMMLLRILQNENQKRMQRVEAVQAACEAQSVEELKRTLEAEGADRIITNRRIEEYEAADAGKAVEKVSAAGEERARQLKKRAEEAEERFAERKASAEGKAADAVPDTIPTAGAKTAAKPEGDPDTAAKEKKRAPSYRDVSDSASSVVIHIADAPEPKREIPLPDDIEDLLEDIAMEESAPKKTKQDKKESGKTEEGRTGKKKKNGFIRFAAALLILAGAAACGFYFYIHSFYVLSNYLSDRQVPENLSAEAMLAAEGRTLPDSAEAGTLKADASAARKKAADQADKNIKNLLLVVLGKEEGGYYGSADGIVLASMNTDTKEMTFRAFRTDLYAEIPGHGVGCLGDAAAYGGCPLLVRTLADTYGIPVTHYMCTDLDGLRRIVDEAGGIPLALENEDPVKLNVVIKELASADEADPEAFYLTESRAADANGYQAAAAVSLHKGSGDMLAAAAEGIFKKVSAKDTGALIKKMLPFMTHNMPMGTVIAGVPSLAGIFGYETKAEILPPEGMFSETKGLLVPDFDEFFALLAAHESAPEESAPAESTAAESGEESVSESISESSSTESRIPEPEITPADPWILEPAA